MRGRGFITEPSLKTWNKILLVLNVLAVTIDPLFFYIPIVKDDRRCRGFDTKLMYAVVALRILTDIGDIINIIVQFCNDSATTYLYTHFIVDVLAILPLPQVVILYAIPHMRYTRLMDFRNVLVLLVFLQYAPRILRIYPRYEKVKLTAGIFTETTWAKAMFNLFLFLLASHVLGASWYFFSLQRETSCLVTACRRLPGCSASSFYCHGNSEKNDYVSKYCPIETPDKSLFDFGIFLDALQSGIVESTNFLEKFFYCFLWGLRNLSSFGQGLDTSRFIWENGFSVLITISGLVLFIAFIGNMQIYLQASTLRQEEMRLKRQDIEQWTSFRLLSDGLQKQVKSHQQYKWRKTRGLDIKNLLSDLPKDLRMNIKRELCLPPLRNVPMLNIMNGQLLDAIYDRLKPVLFPDGHCILRKGDPVEEMLFITQGNVTTNSGTVNNIFLRAGNFCGEELLIWALNQGSSFNLPASTRSVRAIGEVEAFALMADDLKLVWSQFDSLHSKQLLNTFRYYSREWRMWAACYIQRAWRSHTKKKLDEALKVEENRLLHALARGNACSQCLGTTICASRFAANALRALGSRGSGRLTERVPQVLVLKPTDPNFTSQE